MAMAKRRRWQGWMDDQDGEVNQRVWSQSSKREEREVYNLLTFFLWQHLFQDNMLTCLELGLKDYLQHSQNLLELGSITLILRLKGSSTDSNKGGWLAKSNNSRGGGGKIGTVTSNTEMTSSTTRTTTTSSTTMTSSATRRGACRCRVPEQEDRQFGVAASRQQRSRILLRSAEASPINLQVLGGGDGGRRAEGIDAGGDSVNAVWAAEMVL